MDYRAVNITYMLSLLCTHRKKKSVGYNYCSIQILSGKNAEYAQPGFGLIPLKCDAYFQDPVSGFCSLQNREISFLKWLWNGVFQA